MAITSPTGTPPALGVLAERMTHLAVMAGLTVTATITRGTVIHHLGWTGRAGDHVGYIASDLRGRITGAVIRDLAGLETLPYLGADVVYGHLADAASVGLEDGDWITAWLWDNAAEDAGELAGDDRLTCHWCPDVWNSPLHTHHPVTGRAETIDVSPRNPRVDNVS